MIVLPPPPELGWYPEDAQWLQRQGMTATGQSRDTAIATAATPGESVPGAAAENSEEWDSTVLSSRSAAKLPEYVLRNTQNGQEIVLKNTTLLGRKPSLSALTSLAGGAHLTNTVNEVAVLVDSTRTVSRNHAVVEFLEDGGIWISDLGSLNGTYIIEGDDESQVVQGTPVELHEGTTLRIGDEFYDFGRVAGE